MVVVFTALTIYGLLAGSFSPAWVSKQAGSIYADLSLYRSEEELVEETRALHAKSRVSTNFWFLFFCVIRTQVRFMV